MKSGTKAPVGPALLEKLKEARQRYLDNQVPPEEQHYRQILKIVEDSCVTSASLGRTEWDEDRDSGYNDTSVLPTYKDPDGALLRRLQRDLHPLVVERVSWESIRVSWEVQ